MAQTLTLTTLAVNGVLPPPLGDNVNTSGALTLPGVGAAERLLLLVTNTDAAVDAVITVAAGSDPPAHAAGVGGLAFTVNGTGGAFPAVVVGPLSSDRFAQNDGSIHLTAALGAGAGVTIIAYQLPRL